MTPVANWHRIVALQAEIERLKTAISKENDNICQTLAQAIGGFPWYCEDQENFPGATKEDGVCVGEHVAASLAVVAANEIRRLHKEITFWAGEKRENDPRIVEWRRLAEKPDRTPEEHKRLNDLMEEFDRESMMLEGQPETVERMTNKRRGTRRGRAELEAPASDRKRRESR